VIADGSVVVARDQVADDDPDPEGGDRHHEGVVASDAVHRLPPARELLADAFSRYARVVENVFDAPGYFLREILPSFTGPRERAILSLPAPRGAAVRNLTPANGLR